MREGERKRERGREVEGVRAREREREKGGLTGMLLVSLLLTRSPCKDFCMRSDGFQRCCR